MNNPVSTSVSTSTQEAATKVNFSQVLKRLKESLNVGSDSELARVLNIKQSSISSAKARQQVPSNWITHVSKEHGISADWLLYGIGVKSLEGVERAYNELERLDEGREAPPQVEEDVLMVSKVKAKLNAGSGSFITSGEVIGRYAFRQDWIQTKGTPENMVLMVGHKLLKRFVRQYTRVLPGAVGRD